MTWKIENDKLDQQSLLVNESIFSLGNGYIGVRGNFEEGYKEDYKSIRGTYLNAFFDNTDIHYGEKGFAYPETQQKLLNVIDTQTVQIYVDDELFSLFEGEVLSYERKLHLDKGFSERIVHWKSPKGKEVKVQFRRLISFVTKELFTIDVIVEPVTNIKEIKIISIVNGDVSNYVDKSDPRVASDHSKRLSIVDIKRVVDKSIIVDRTYRSNLEVACITKSLLNVEHTTSATVTEASIEETFTCSGNQPIQFTKLNVLTDTLRHGEKIVSAGLEIIKTIEHLLFEDLLAVQKLYLDKYWENTDIEIKGDIQLQEGIRFNLYQLLQSAGKDGISNIAAKGLSGEGYEGHYFWDTEIYIFPIFLMSNPEQAKQLLKYRYSILEHAKSRAIEMGHKKGALFPWRTISGTECSSFFPAGTAQYHISADIAYSNIQYYLVTKDVNYIAEFGAEILFETARLWNDIGHYYLDTFRIDAVTGPDEYTCIVNNNYYTNVMAKNNLQWAVKFYDILKENDKNAFQALTERLAVTKAEVEEWQKAAKVMYLAYDEGLDINPQDDTFLQKAVWDFENTPKEKYPLLLNYHPLTIYRYQVLKQADTVLAHYLLEDEQKLETIKNSFDYYEKITTHDSSLSYCIYSIMAAKLGYYEKAYQYFIETARLDLDNTHGNTKDGLHMANMGGTWLAIVQGFAGLRVKESGMSLAPFIPKEWEGYTFAISYQNRTIKVEIDQTTIRCTLSKGAPLTFKLYDQSITLEGMGTVHSQELQR